MGNTKTRKPVGVHLGTYRRRMPVTLERMFENALDWEHLPWLHSRSFSDITKLDAGAWGWRAKATLAATDPQLLPEKSLWKAAFKRSARYQPWRFIRFSAGLVFQLLVSGASRVELELLLDTDKRQWVTTTLAGIGKGGEIWTEVLVHGEQDIEVIVDFYMPAVPAPLVAPLGEYFKNLYQRLYDEDQEMMELRHSALAVSPSGDEKTVDLGPLSALKSALPLTVSLAKKQWQLREHGGELVVHAVYCTHMLGPLSDAAISENNEIQCPWHGYCFDVASGANTSGQRCRLPVPPKVELANGNVRLVAA